MRRWLPALTVLLLAVASLVSAEAVASALVEHAPSAVSAVDDCCPDADADDEGCDCCDADLGACHAGPASAALVHVTTSEVARGALIGTPRQDASWERYLRERLRGPPPTPPPIG